MELLVAHRARVQLAVTLLIVVPIFSADLFGPAPIVPFHPPTRAPEPTTSSVRSEVQFVSGSISEAWGDLDRHNPFRRATSREPLPPVTLAPPPRPDTVPLRFPVLPLAGPAVLTGALAASAVPGGNPPPPVEGEGPDAPPSESVEEPAAIAEPSLSDRVRPYDRLYTTSVDFSEGTILDENSESIVLRNPSGTSRVDLPRDSIVRIERRRTLEEVYRSASKEFLQRQDRVGLLDLGRECVRFSALHETGLEILAEYILGVGSRDVAAYLMQIEIQRQRHDLDGVFETLEQAFHDSGLDDPALYEARARAYLDLGTNFASAALADARRSVVEESTIHRQVLIGRSLDLLGRRAEAIEVLRAAASVGGAEEGVELDLARYLYSAGASLEALAVLADHTSIESRVLSGSAHYLRGEIENAKAWFVSACSLDPTHPIATQNLAVAQLEGGDPATALETFEQAARLQLADPSWARLAQALATLRSGDVAGASISFDLAREANPSNWYVDYVEGIGRHEAGDPENADRLLRRALDAAFEFVDLLDRLGRVALDRGLPQEAVRYFAEAATREPGARRFLLLGGALLESGRIDEAETAYRRCLTYSGETEEVLAHLGLGYLENARGNFGQALENFDEVRDRHPYAEASYRSIEENLARWRWTDHFTRPQGLALFRKWRETEPAGILIRIALVEDEAPGSTLSAVLEPGDDRLEVDDASSFVRNGNEEGLVRVGQEWIEYGQVSGGAIQGLVRGVLSTTASRHAVGSEVVAARHAASLEGTQTEAWAPTLLGQVVGRDVFERFDATLRNGRAGAAFVGIGFFPPEAEVGSEPPIFAFGVDWRGDLVYGNVIGSSRPRFQRIRPFAGARRFALGVVPQRGLRSVDLILDGEVVVEDAPVEVPIRKGNLQVGIVVLADRDVEWNVIVEKASYVFREER